MTHHLTPREKPLEQVAYEGWAQGLPGCEWSNQTETQKRAWSKAASSVLTALASGSGDHSGGVTDMIGSGDQLSGNPGILKSGDHAELARLAEAATPGEWELDGHQCLSAPDGTIVVDYSCCSRGEWEANAAYLRAVQPSRTLALIAEVAALRAQHEADMAEVVRAGQNLQSQRLALTEAERKLAEAAGLLAEFKNQARVGYGGAPVTRSRRVNVPSALFHKICAWLSKEAERG